MLELVPNSPRYYEFIRQLRNDERTKQGFVNQQEITKRKHAAFMRNYAVDYRICLLDGEPVGFVAVVKGDIRVCVHPDHQKKGVGKFMITEYFREHEHTFPECKIKANNVASQKLFESCGFRVKYLILERFILPKT